MRLFISILSVCVIIATAMGFSFEAWSKNNYQGTAKTYTKRGTFYPGYTIRSYRWISKAGDGCCVRMCNGGGSVGYYCPSKSNGVPSASFNKIVIGCGSEQINC